MDKTELEKYEEVIIILKGIKDLGWSAPYWLTR